MRHTFTYSITEKNHNDCLLSFLHQEGYSRHLLISMKPFPGSIRINDTPAFLHTKLSAGDLVSVTLPPEEKPTNILPRPVAFSVCYEDNDLIVLDKPAHVPVHPSILHREDSLANGIALYMQKKKETYPFRCINRLDRDTTGLLLLAKHALSAAVLSAEMRKRQIRRTYLAIVEGTIREEGTIRLPIGRKSGSIIERCVDPENGETAVTHYFPQAVYRREHDRKTCTLLQLHLETGRTHQIRVHMAAVGHPLIGDSLYNPHGIPGMTRQALHSSELSFFHPIEKKEQHFVSALPEDIRTFLQQFTD